MAGNNALKIDKKFAGMVLKEGLLHENGIKVTDSNLFDILSTAGDGNKGALEYLKTSPEILSLLDILSKEETTYTTENFDAICDYLAKFPPENLYLSFDDYEQEDLPYAILHLMENLTQLQTHGDVFYFFQCFKKAFDKMSYQGFPPEYKQDVFVVKTYIDFETKHLICELFVGKKELEIEVDDEPDEDYSESDYISNQYDDIFDLTNFISAWKKHIVQKDLILNILENRAYQRTIFQMFDLNENDLTS